MSIENVMLDHKEYVEKDAEKTETEFNRVCVERRPIIAVVGDKKS